MSQAVNEDAGEGHEHAHKHEAATNGIKSRSKRAH